MLLRVEVTDPTKVSAIGSLTDTNADGTPDYFALLLAGANKQIVIPQTTFNAVGDYIYTKISDVDANTLLGFYTTANNSKISNIDYRVLKLLGQGNLFVSADVLYNTQTHGVFSDVYVFDTVGNRMTSSDIQTVKAFYTANNGDRASSTIRVLVFTDDDNKLNPSHNDYISQAIGITAKNADKGLWTDSFDR